MKFINRIKRKIILLLINVFFSGTRFFEIKRYLLKKAGFIIGKNSKIVGPFVTSNVSKISIGENTWIGSNFTVSGNGTFIVGDFCDIGPDVSILTGTHKIGPHNHRAGEGIDLIVNIGDGCWIGAKSTLLGNIKVNDGAIIAAGSMVIRDVRSDTLVGGIPAKEIKDL